MTTFHSARLKLTTWYLIIIMLISVLFSVAFYQASTREIKRIINRIEFRQKFPESPLPDRLPPPGSPTPPTLEDLEAAKKQLLIVLVFINGGIFAIAGAAGYFLAGRTLKPIREMIDEQNRFITDASHELKTPLTALRSEFEVAILEEKKLQLKEAKHLIKSGFEEIVNLQGLAENLLQLTHQQKKIGQLRKEELSLLEIIEAALKRIISLAKQKQITINNSIDDYIFEGEAHSLTELFVIFLDNAIKYNSKDSEITITSKQIDHHIQIEVIDNGIGIDEKDIPYIFDRFYRADKSRSRIPGYGLGLSIAKQIVEAHNGSIAVQSSTDTGTTFIVRLPIAKF